MLEKSSSKLIKKTLEQSPEIVGEKIPVQMQQ